MKVQNRKSMLDATCHRIFVVSAPNTNSNHPKIVSSGGCGEN